MKYSIAILLLAIILINICFNDVWLSRPPINIQVGFHDSTGTRRPALPGDHQSRRSAVLWPHWHRLHTAPTLKSTATANEPPNSTIFGDRFSFICTHPALHPWSKELLISGQDEKSRPHDTRCDAILGNLLGGRIIDQSGYSIVVHPRMTILKWQLPLMAGNINNKENCTLKYQFM